MSENCDVIASFPIYGQFRAIWKADSGRIVENRTKESLTQLSHYCFEQRYYFGQKTLIFCKKMLISGKLGGP